jgi:hypothetical protein
MPYEDGDNPKPTTTSLWSRTYRDLVLVYKSIFGCIDLNIEQFVFFVQHSRSRSQNPSLVLKPSYCKTSTFQASFFNRVVKPWNLVCKIVSRDKFASLSIFKRFLYNDIQYSNLVGILRNPDSDPDSDSKKIRTREKTGPGLEKNPNSCFKKPGLDFWKPGVGPPRLCSATF